MSKYTILEHAIYFYNQRNEALDNVSYTLVFISKDGTKETYKDKTDKNGKTKLINITKNGNIHIFVEGFSSIFATKKTIKPILAEGSSIIQINEKSLDDNLKFPTESQYKLQQKANAQAIENIKKAAQKNNKGSTFFGSLGGNTSGFPTLDKSNKPNLYQKILEPISYTDYKKNNTIVIKKTNRLKFKNYAMFQFVLSNNKPVANIKYQIFGVGQDKPIVHLKPSPADAKGFTQLANTYRRVYLKYFIGDKEHDSQKYNTITCVDPQVIYQIIFPASKGTTYPNATNKASLSSLKKPPIIINPHTNEVLILPPSLYQEFDKKTSTLAKAVEKVHQSNANLRRAIQERDIDQIREMEGRLNIDQKEAIDKINGEFQARNDLEEVLIAEQVVENGKTKTNLLRRYLKPANYNKLKNSRLNEELRVEISNAANQNGVENPNNIQKSFDAISSKLLNAKGEIGSDEKAIYNLIGGLGGEISEQYRNSNGIDVSQQAQWMRLVAGGKGEAELSVSSQGVKLNASGDASAKWTIFEGKKEWRKFYPSEYGWNIEYENYSLGEIRFLIGCEVSGFSGANLGIAGNLSIDITHQGATQVITAVAREPQRSIANMMNRQNRPSFKAGEGDVELMQETKENKNTAHTEIKAFAGVNISGALKGGIEWFDPGIDGESKPQFVTIAIASLGGGVSAGVGAEGQFQIGYSAASNTFRILVAAHLCWGVGAKGTAAFDVGTDQLMNFAGFLKSQLGYAGFKTLAFVNSASFMMLSQALAYCIGDDHKLTKNVRVLSEKYLDWIDQLDVDQGRLQTARRVNSNTGRRELLYATPETKGILLYAVSHWTDRTAPILDIRIGLSLTSVEVDFFPERKTAIINILATCITEAEWKNTIQHIHPEGLKLTESQLGKVEGDLVRFLNYDKLENEKVNDERAKTIIHCINQGIEYGGDLNKWLKKYIEYRKGVKKIQNHRNYMLVRNQDDYRFKTFEEMQDYENDLGQQVLMASNLETLAPFGDAYSLVESNPFEDQEYNV